MRHVFSRTFTPRRLGALEPVILRVVDELLDRMADAGKAVVDFVADFAYPIPALVMAEFIGIPAGELAWYRERVEWIDEFLDVAGKTPERLAAANTAAEELRVFYRELLAHRRRVPGDDLLSGLVEALDSGEVELTEEELISNLIVLFNASFVTTVYMFSNGLPLLLGPPGDLVAAMPTDAKLAAGCVDEVLRLESPVHFLARAAAADTEVGGVPVAQDDNVLIIDRRGQPGPGPLPGARTASPDRAGPPQLGLRRAAALLPRGGGVPSWRAASRCPACSRPVSRADRDRARRSSAAASFLRGIDVLLGQRRRIRSSTAARSRRSRRTGRARRRAVVPPCTPRSLAEARAADLAAIRPAAARSSRCTEVTRRAVPGPAGELPLRIYRPAGSGPLPTLVCTSSAAAGRWAASTPPTGSAAGWPTRRPAR